MGFDIFRDRRTKELNKRMKKRTSTRGSPSGRGGVSQRGWDGEDSFSSDSGANYKDFHEWEQTVKDGTYSRMKLGLAEDLESEGFGGGLHRKVKLCGVCQRPNFALLEWEGQTDAAGRETGGRKDYHHICKKCQAEGILNKEREDFVWNHEKLGSMIGGNETDAQDYLKTLFDSEWYPEKIGRDQSVQRGSRRRGRRR